MPILSTTIHSFLEKITWNYFEQKVLFIAFNGVSPLFMSQKWGRSIVVLLMSHFTCTRTEPWLCSIPFPPWARRHSPPPPAPEQPTTPSNREFFYPRPEIAAVLYRSQASYVGVVEVRMKTQQKFQSTEWLKTCVSNFFSKGVTNEGKFF